MVPLQTEAADANLHQTLNLSVPQELQRETFRDDGRYLPKYSFWMASTILLLLLLLLHHQQFQTRQTQSSAAAIQGWMPDHWLPTLPLDDDAPLIHLERVRMELPK